jgi:hypothetical protein
LAKPVEIKVKESKQLTKVFNKVGAKTLLPKIRKEWNKDSLYIAGQVTKNQLSGRRGQKGLNRRSGAAAESILGRARIENKDVVAKVYLDKGNRAREYLPIHDASWTKSRTIRHPGGTPYKIIGDGKAVFVKKGTKDITGITAPHNITIPQRTDIVGEAKKLGKKVYVESVKKVVSGLLK